MSRTPDRFLPEAIPDVASTATALADQPRAAMCAALMDDRVWTVGEPSSHVGVARSAASEHVNMLGAHDLITRTRQGRHCYVTISGPEATRVVGALGTMSVSVLPVAHSLNARTVNKRLLAAHTCYRRLVGRLDVSLVKHPQERGHPDPSWRPTNSGGDPLATRRLEKPRRARGEACVNPTERQFHLSRPLGTALTQMFFDQAQIACTERSRAVKITAIGRGALAQAGLMGVLTLLDETTSNDAAG